MLRQVFSCVCALFLFTSSVTAQPQPKSGFDQITAILDQIKKSASLKFSATTTQDAIDVAFNEIDRLSEVSLVAWIDEEAANTELARMINVEKSRLRNPSIHFSDQTASGSLGFSGPLLLGPLGAVDVSAELQMAMAVAVSVVSERGASEFKIKFAVTKLETRINSVSRNGQPIPGLINEIAQATINEILIPAQALFNRIELFVPTTISVDTKLDPIKKDGVAVRFSTPELATKIQISALSTLMDQGRLTIVAQESGTTKAAGKSKNVGIAALRAKFQAAVGSTEASWLNSGNLGAYVSETLIQRLAASLLATGPICANAVVSEMPIPVHAKLKLPSEQSIDCSPKKECASTRSCEPTRNCDALRDCTPRRNCDAVKDCGGYAWYQAFDKGRCEAEKSIAKGKCEAQKSLEKGSCEVNKTAAKADCERLKSQEKGQCELEKSSEKALCEAGKTAEKGACETFKDAYKRFRATGGDYGNVDSNDLTIAGSAGICVQTVSFNAKETKIKLNLVAQAHAIAVGTIKFTPLNVAGHLTCLAPFSHKLAVEADVPSQQVEIDTSALYVADKSKVSLTASVSAPISLRIPVSSIVQRLVMDPAFAIECPIPHTAMVIRVATPDRWWPKEARGDIQKEVPALKFELDIIQKPEKAGNLRLAGALLHSNKGTGGVFTVDKGKSIARVE